MRSELSQGSANKKMSNIQFLVHPLPGTEDQLIDRIQEVSVRLSYHELWLDKVTEKDDVIYYLSSSFVA